MSHYCCPPPPCLQVRGILNGIDTVEWNPSRDPYLAANYNAQFLEGKQLCKRYLQQVGPAACRTAAALSTACRLHGHGCLRGVCLYAAAAAAAAASARRLPLLPPPPRAACHPALPVLRAGGWRPFPLSRPSRLCPPPLLQGLGLETDPTKPLVAVVTRLVPQKGIHLIRAAIYRQAHSHCVARPHHCACS